MMDKRLTELNIWLNTVLDEPIENITSASEDASFRRYFRVTTHSGSYVAMDAPPLKEPLDSFIMINKALIAQHVHAPLIHHQNREDGFLLLEDLGNTTYLEALPDAPDHLYQAAIASLIRIQCGTFEQPQVKLPNYDTVLLNKELDLFNDWYLQKHLGLHLNRQEEIVWQECKSFLIETCLNQPQVWVHRDFHSRNLMVTNNHLPAVIDFQDMVLGPLSYDLASLFKDCYIEWPRTKQHRWLLDYQKQAQNAPSQLSFSQQQLIEWVDLTGLQRHLKVLGIFSRLNYRDDKPHYLDDLPLVTKYVLEVLELYPQLRSFSSLFKQLIRL